MNKTVPRYSVLCCPKCQLTLKKVVESYYCSECKKNYSIAGGIIRLIPSFTEDLKLSILKWDKIYFNQLTNESYYDEYQFYKKTYLKDTLTQLHHAKHLTKNDVYLEIGCGSFFLGQSIASEVGLIIGIDMCPSALIIAKKMLDKNKVKNYILIQGDIMNMPIKNNVIDLVYGGGVIEHFNNTQKCVNELFRVLKKGGVSFNTVPYLNIGSLTYRQVWGNIPNVPLLRQIFEFIHLKILGGKHMIFGYEMSFLSSTLISIHKAAKFKKISVEKFDVQTIFEFLPPAIRPIFIWLANNSRLFWPMIKVVAQK
ncbi:MAG: methyltransferase domain-containing protein [bacterium]